MHREPSLRAREAGRADKYQILKHEPRRAVQPPPRQRARPRRARRQRRHRAAVTRCAASALLTKPARSILVEARAPAPALCSSTATRPVPDLCLFFVTRRAYLHTANSVSVPTTRGAAIMEMARPAARPPRTTRWWDVHRIIRDEQNGQARQEVLDWLSSWVRTLQ